MKSQHQSQSQHTNVVSIGDNEMANIEQNYDGRSFDNSSHETFTEIDMLPAQEGGLVFHLSIRRHVVIQFGARGSFVVIMNSQCSHDKAISLMCL